MYKQLTVFVFALAVLHPLTESHNLSHFDIYLIRRFIKLAQALKHGDDCSWEAEWARQNYTRGIIMAPGNFSLVVQMANEFWKNGFRLCSSYQLLVCDKESRKCVCGDPGYESTHGVNRSLYTFEEDGKCRWNEGTHCISDNFLRSSGWSGIRVDSRCKSGTTCRNAGGSVCSVDDQKWHHIVRSGYALVLDQRRAVEEHSSGGPCSCKVDEHNKSHIAFDWDVPNNDTVGIDELASTANTTEPQVSTGIDSDTLFDAPAAEGDSQADLTTTTIPEENTEVDSDTYADAPEAGVEIQAPMTTIPSSSPQSEDEREDVEENENPRPHNPSLDEFVMRSLRMRAKYSAGFDYYY